MAITLDGTNGSTQPAVILTGATSGTVTLTPPAVAGTTTITLPATSGTLLQSGTTVTIAQGGTGQITASAAFDALAPSQTSNSGKYLTTNGTTTSWGTVSGSSQWTTSGSNIYYTTGNVGIGQTSPSVALVVSGTASVNAAMQRVIQVFDQQTAATGVGGGISFGGYITGTSGTGEFSSIQGVKENATAGDYAGALYFTTRTNGNSPAERMRIDSSGNLLVGTTSALKTTFQKTSSSDYIFDIRNTSTAAAAYGLTINYPVYSPNASGSQFITCADSTTNRFYVQSNGGIANYSANNSNLSDVREKKNISLAGNYLDKINAIPVKTFLFNDQTDEQLNLGVIAQDVQAVAPELVAESDWGTAEEPKMRLSIYQTDLQYALMKAIQELTARVAALESK
jgi:hypothetical protein